LISGNHWLPATASLESWPPPRPRFQAYILPLNGSAGWILQTDSYCCVWLEKPPCMAASLRFA